MPINSPRLTKELVNAYFETEYVVDNWPNSFALRAGRLSRQLQQLHHEKNVETSAYITAFNPFSQALTTADNEQRMEQLKQDITARWPYLTGEGKDPQGKWPGEPSFLILGISEEDAHALAVKYEQFAYLYCKSSQVSEFARVSLKATDSYDRKTLWDVEQERRDKSRQERDLPRRAHSASWLRDFIKEAVEKKWCVNIGCTTCGALDFRQGLKTLIEERADPDRRYEVLARQLGAITESDLSEYRFADALNMAFHEFSQPILAGGYPGLEEKISEGPVRRRYEGFVRAHGQ